MVTIERMKNKHLLAVKEIDNKFWTDEQFKDVGKCGNVFSYVILVNGVVVGYVFYALTSRYLNIINFSIHPEHRRFGFGSLLLDHLKTKLTSKRREIEVYVKETNLPAQLFLRKNFVKCYEIIGEIYVFKYRKPDANAP